jgi:hypothetical protein
VTPYSPHSRPSRPRPRPRPLAHPPPPPSPQPDPLIHPFADGSRAGQTDGTPAEGGQSGSGSPGQEPSPNDEVSDHNCYLALIFSASRRNFLPVSADLQSPAHLELPMRDGCLQAYLALPTRSGHHQAYLELPMRKGRHRAHLLLPMRNSHRQAHLALPMKALGPHRLLLLA